MTTRKNIKPGWYTVKIKPIKETSKGIAVLMKDTNGRLYEAYIGKQLLQVSKRGTGSKVNVKLRNVRAAKPNKRR